MKKNLLKGMAALFALFTLGTMNASAEDLVGTAPVKMTYIDYNQADVAMGQLDTIRAGYNKVPAVGGTIGFGNTGWGENKIGVLKVDVSSIPGTVQTATLKAKISGSSDSKRITGWGVALTDNEWAADLTYATAGSWTVSAVLNGGNQQWSSTKSATVFEEKEWDITEALSGGNLTATLLVFETAAAGGYMTEAYVEVTYDPFDATVTKYDFEDDVNIFTNDSRIGSAIATDDVLGSKVTVFTAAGNCQNGYGFAHYDFTDKLNQPANVAVEFDYYNQSGTRSILTLGDRLVRMNDGGCSKNTYGSKGAIFRIGSDKSNAFINGITLPQADKETPVYQKDEEGNDVLDEEGNPVPALDEEGNPIVNKTFGFCDKWLHVYVIASIDARTVAWTVSDQEGNVLHQGFDAFWQDDANELSQIDVFAWINNSMSGKVDNLTITNYKSNAVFAEYTIRYVNPAGEEIKASRTGNGQVGKLVKLLDSDKESVKLEDNSMKYIYDTDDSDVVTIAEDGSAVITVTFREAEICYAILNCYKEGTTDILFQFRDLDTQWFWEGDTYAFYPARGVNSDNAYYFTAATSWNGATFNFPGSITPRKQGGANYYIGTLYYSLVDSVAYYSDIERLALPVEDDGYGKGLGQLEGTVNSWYSFSGGYFDRFSGARGIRLDENSYVWTEPITQAGTYKVSIYGRNDNSANQPVPYALGLRDAEGNVLMYADITAPDWSSATTGYNIVEGVSIPAGSSLVIKNVGTLTEGDAPVANKISLDDISLTMTGEYVDPNLVTSIDNIQTMNVQNGVVYNLNGQAVQKAQKGLYILNGKKYIVK